ncbi:TonB-dependent receptor [Nannocystis pusilla]|uniref:TonB-dependent receptor n=1 Tax=Nannocystis pusilla TaxID=889268 RepID=A0ABS7TYJ3_9BACT|nr:TonB-dependent receptor [Nannocystis pusilla]MBZ5713268.1 TonB-dependent receptor [Nannocystis pusilla]
MITALLGLLLALAGPPAVGAKPVPSTSRTQTPALAAATSRPVPSTTRNQPVPSTIRLEARGTLRSAGERQPLAGARIFARARRGPAWTREAVTAGDGSFVLADLPALDFELVVVAGGHERLEQPTTAAFWRRRRPPVIYLQPTGSGRYRTIVAQERTPRPSPFSVELGPDEIAALPGSQGDPLRALQNLPGAARVPGGLGLLVLRGAAPNQSQVFVGEHPVPRAFHIPGLASIVPGGVLSGLQYVPSNFAANYGNATGGLVVLTPRVGRRDGLHGHAKLDIISAGALVEGPVGRGSFLIAAQRGYLDLALGVVGRLAFGRDYLRPKYSDYQVVFDHPVGPGASLTARLLGASDLLRFDSHIAGAQGVALSSSFHRLDLVYKKRHGAWDFLLSPALRLDRSGVESEAQVQRRTDVVGLLRAEATARVSRRFQLTFGADAQIDRHRTRTHIDVSYINSVDDVARGVTSTSGAYVTPLLTLGRLTLSPGLRASLFAARGEPKFSIDPRLHARWAPHARVAVQLGAGRYSQPHFVPGSPLPNVSNSFSALDSLGIDTQIVLPGAIRYLDPRLDISPHSRLGLRQALQLSASVHLQLTAALGLDATAFWRRDRTQSPAPTGGWHYGQRDAAGLTYGLEVMLRHDLTRRLFGWLAYTWMRGRFGTFTSDGRAELRFPNEFDQRHNLVAVLGLKLPRRWQLAGRFRVVTGLPYTPIVGGIKQDGARPITQPLAGEYNSARMPVFHQLDLRVDKTWVLSRAIVSAYLDVQNVYNRQNAEGVWYLDDYSGTRSIVGVPILPVLGVRLDY